MMILVDPFTNISGNFTYWLTQGYVNVLGFLFLPLLYTGIIGYVYVRLRSATAGVVAILVIFSAIGEAFLRVDPLTSFFHILVALVVTTLIIAFVSRVRR